MRPAPRVCVTSHAPRVSFGFQSIKIVVVKKNCCVPAAESIKGEEKSDMRIHPDKGDEELVLVEVICEDNCVEKL